VTTRDHTADGAEITPRARTLPSVTVFPGIKVDLGSQVSAAIALSKASLGPIAFAVDVEMIDPIPETNIMLR
jgi:hypothetical protein